MAIMRLPTTMRNALADALARRIDGGGGAGTISLYTGPLPESADTPVGGQILLGKLTCSYPVGTGGTHAGVLTFDAIAEDPSAASSGTAAWARIADAAGAPVFDCDVTEPGAGGTIEMNTTRIVAGGPIRLRGFIITFPAG